MCITKTSCTTRPQLATVVDADQNARPWPVVLAKASRQCRVVVTGASHKLDGFIVLAVHSFRPVISYNSVSCSQLGRPLGKQPLNFCRVLLAMLLACLVVSAGFLAANDSFRLSR
jgi:hypothetical protein